ncbi:hypothetical protein [Pseudarthrobacter sp. fls2-241-R2A-168]|uniref:hypothetical protein n=1 Tax=Pseudarthrobacter sp. fls2-241-R2A-168 TaxID=3040304 RepID=UPI002557ADC5|nr:hypothetical protein [Pseudarthrobacter sp. fls2-241-R2A-168]
MQGLGAATAYNIDGGGSGTSAGLGEGSVDRAAEQSTVTGGEYTAEYTAVRAWAEAAAARAGNPQRSLT